MDATPKRRPFRFSLRTLLVLVTIASVGLGWLGLKVRQAQREREVVEAIKKLNGIAWYDYQFDSDDSLTDSPTPPGPAWLRKLVGDNFFANVAYCRFLLDSEVTDAELIHLEGLNRLRWLDIGNTKITDAGLVYLQGLTQLKCLDLAGTQLTDAGLVHLQGLNRLERLTIYNTQVTDAGLVHLQGLKKLDELYVFQTKVTDAGCRELQKALPKLTIHR
jgi:Leucine-rich repeat (LRR) protein